MAVGRRLLSVIALTFVAATFIGHAISWAQDAPATRASAVQRIEPLISPKLAPLSLPEPTPPSHFPRSDPLRPSGGLQNLVRCAGLIFSGKVISIGRDGPLPEITGRPFAGAPNPASTSITFQIERAIRGVEPGQTLTIHEWAGLWSHGERYSVGEHVLLFLYAASKLGFTSPVSGALGKFAMDSRGTITISRLQGATLALDPVLAGRTEVSYPEFMLALRRSGWEELRP